jgi:hypothetical protein
MKLGAVIEHLRRSADDLADEIRAVGERHAAQQDVYHMSHTLSARIEALATSLDPFMEAYGQGSSDGGGGESIKAFAEKVRRTTSTLTARSSKTGLVLLKDLRELFAEASTAEIDWTIVRQGAMAARDDALVRLATVGLEETGRVLRWLKTRIKEASPQILMSAD